MRVCLHVCAHTHVACILSTPSLSQLSPHTTATTITSAAKTLEGHGDATLFLRPFSAEVPRAPLAALLRERGGPYLRFALSDPGRSPAHVSTR